MIYTHFTTALIAAVLMLWAWRSYGPFIRLGLDTAGALSRLGVCAVTGMVFVRMAWWDIARPVLGWIGAMPPMRYSTLGVSLNTAFNVGYAIAALMLLAALYRSIPADKRGPYNWFTAYRYPPKDRDNSGFAESR